MGRGYVLLKGYYVTVPVRSTQSYVVVATSAREAEQLVNENGSSHPDVEPLDFTPEWHGRAVARRAPKEDPA